MTQDYDAARASVGQYKASGGHWHPALDPLVERSPAFVEAMVAFAGHPWKSGPLDRKTKELLSLALHACVTHLNAPGIRTHIRGALRAGASQDEILEVLQLVSVVGVHAAVLGVPILVEKLRAQSPDALDLSNADPERAALKAEFLQSRGYWSDIWDGMLALDPGYFRAFTDFSSAPWRGGVLAPKIKEFVYIAMDISTTHQFVPGTHIHIENAIGYGATAEELMEVVQLSSVLGMDTFQMALPILAEELAELDKAGDRHGA
jgi:alkylhydroperoxidase/carboxymuconolactone decarboxylase family protein YurZ